MIYYGTTLRLASKNRLIPDNFFNVIQKMEPDIFSSSDVAESIVFPSEDPASNIDIPSYTSEIIDEINQIEKKEETVESALSSYSKIEEKKLLQIKNKFNYISAKKLLNDTLFNNFLRHYSSKRIKIYKHFMKQYHLFLSQIDLNQDLNKYVSVDFDLSKYQKTQTEKDKIRELYKINKKGLYDECITSLMSKNNSIENIPFFLINRKLINQKVNFIWKIKYLLPINEIKSEKNFGGEEINKICESIQKEKKLLFPSNLFDYETFVIMIKCFFISNATFIYGNESDLSKFMEVITKITIFFDLSKSKEVIDNIIEFKVNELKRASIISVYITKEKTYLSQEFKLRLSKEADQKLIYIIANFSLLLNDMLSYNENNKEITINSNIQCSPFEKFLLSNYLTFLDEFILKREKDKIIYSSEYYSNLIIEHQLCTEILKVLSLPLFDQEGRFKKAIGNKEIWELLTVKIKDNEQNQQNLPKKLTFSGINESSFSLSFLEFTSKLPKYHLNCSFIPHDPLKISTHITIIVSDSFDSSIFNQLSSVNQNNDYYFFDWDFTDESKNVFQKLFNDKKDAYDIVGKYLAYILASRCIFSFQTISLIGIGHGCNIIKQCIHQLSSIHLNCSKGKDIISNVLFVQGKCNLENNDLEDFDSILTGKLYNTYNEKERGKYITQNEIKHNKVINTDFSFLKIKDEEWCYLLSCVINTINFS